MFRVLGCISSQHDLRLVLLAGLISALACYTSFSVAARASGAGWRRRNGWLLAAALVLGGGIWTTHFVFELAYRPGLPIAYDVNLTVLSVLIAVTLSGFGIALRHRHAILGGAVVGLAIAAMHFTGMAALRLPGVIVWDTRFVAVSIAIGLSFAAAAMHIAVTRDDTKGRIAASAFLVVAILGLHATAMAAVRILPDSTMAIPQQSIQPQLLAVAISAVTILIVGLGLFGSIVDQHLAQRTEREAALLREHVAMLEAARMDIESTATQLRHALQAKAAFLATMSHELRTPLNAIIGFSEVLKEQLFGPVENARYRAYHDDIFKSGKHLLGLVDDLLDACTINGSHIELHEGKFDLAAFLADCLNRMRPLAANKQIELSLEVKPGIEGLYADAERLRQIVLNLLSNAIKFTPGGGAIQITARFERETLDISVSDNGIGMAEEDIAAALEMFRQIDNSLSRKYEGVGVGLPIAKQLTERHGGSLAIRSVPGSGTVVTIHLPRSRLCRAEMAA